jgi:hypothetical protein
MSPADRVRAMGGAFLVLKETTLISMRARNPFIDPMPPLSTVKQAAP